VHSNRCLAERADLDRVPTIADENADLSQAHSTFFAQAGVRAHFSVAVKRGDRPLEGAFEGRMSIKNSSSGGRTK